jgi:hypothetical protein
MNYLKLRNTSAALLLTVIVSFYLYLSWKGTAETELSSKRLSNLRMNALAIRV